MYRVNLRAGTTGHKVRDQFKFVPRLNEPAYERPNIRGTIHPGVVSKKRGRLKAESLCPFGSVSNRSCRTYDTPCEDSGVRRLRSGLRS